LVLLFTLISHMLLKHREALSMAHLVATWYKYFAFVRHVRTLSSLQMTVANVNRLCKQRMRFERRNDVEQNQLAHSRRQIAEYITWWSALTFRLPIAFTVSLLSVIVRTMVKQNDAVINNCAIIIHTSR